MRFEEEVLGTFPLGGTKREEIIKQWQSPQQEAFSREAIVADFPQEDNEFERELEVLEINSDFL